MHSRSFIYLHTTVGPSPTPLPCKCSGDLKAHPHRYVLAVVSVALIALAVVGTVVCARRTFKRNLLGNVRPPKDAPGTTIAITGKHRKHPCTFRAATCGMRHACVLMQARTRRACTGRLPEACPQAWLHGAMAQWCLHVKSHVAMHLFHVWPRASFGCVFACICGPRAPACRLIMCSHCRPFNTGL